MTNGATRPIALSISGSSSRDRMKAITAPTTDADRYPTGGGKRERAKPAGPGRSGTDPSP